MNNRQRGRQYELLCKRKLEKNGWLVYLVDMPQRFRKSQDLFGVFDILALKPGEKLWVQVKYNSSHTKRLEPILSDFKAHWLSPSDLVQVWNYRLKSPRIKPGWHITNL